jgi:hypothetical protein
MKRKAKKLTQVTCPKARERIRRANLAQNYYRRADTIETTLTRTAPRKFRIIAECYPAPRLPLIMGVVDGTKAQCMAYATTMQQIAQLMGLRFKQVSHL